jgi:hypothetical protein
MPKAYDDEREFTSEPARDLVRLKWYQRILYLLSAKSVATTFQVAVGLIGFVLAFVAITSPPPTPADSPLVSIGQRLSEQASRIAKARNDIREQLSSLPPGKERDAIESQLQIINEEAAVLKAYGDELANRDKRSSIGAFTPAYAETALPSKLTPDDVRLYGIILILIVLGIAFLLCIGIILFSDHTRRLTFAIDTVKVLMGFFVGVATSFFGVR